MKPQLCSPLGRIVVLIFGLFAFLASPFRAEAAACTSSDLASGSAAFVVNSTGTTTAGSVFLVNASANTVQCSMTVGKDPTNLAVSPDGSLLFVENDADGTVTVLNLTDGTLNKTISLTGTPMTANLAVSPDNTKVYVVTLSATLTATTQASLYVISLSTLTASSPISVVAPLPATATPVTAPGLGVAFTPDSSKAYIATEGLTYIVTTSTDTVSSTTISASGGAAAVQQTGTFAYVIDVAASPATATQINVSTNTVNPQTPTPQCSTAYATAITPDSSRV
jgi:DNA-binding beta-propeller fold protein YncE